MESRGSKLKIGLLGGSFSPITKGHIEIASCVLKVLDKVVLIPCNNHPWGKNLINFEHRFKMCQLSISDNQYTVPVVKDYEVRYNLPGDTFSLINKLKEIPYYKKNDMFFIIGMDEAINFRKWKNYKQLKEMIRFIVVPREGVEIKKKNSWFLKPPHMLLVPETPIPEVSSTDIRDNLNIMYSDNVASGKAYKFCEKHLHPEVFKYIREHNLYKKECIC